MPADHWRRRPGLGPRSSCTSRTPKPAGRRSRPSAPRLGQGPGLLAERARVRGASCTPVKGGRVQVQEGRQAGLQPGGAPCSRLAGTGQGLERGHRRPGRSAGQGCRRGAEPPDAPLARGAHHKSPVPPAGGGRDRRRAHRGERHLLALPRLRGGGHKAWPGPGLHRAPLEAPCTTATSRARRTWSGSWAVHRVSSLSSSTVGWAPLPGVTEACLLRAVFEDDAKGPCPYPGHHRRFGWSGVARHLAARTRVTVLAREGTQELVSRSESAAPT